MKQGIFITATGTDAGKTYVSGLLLKKLLHAKVDAVYFKPALSGAQCADGRLVPGDAVQVCHMAGLPGYPQSMVAYQFEPAVSPHLAARLAGLQIRKNVIMEQYEKVGKTASFVLVEGCGGLVCPLCLEGEPLMLAEVIKAMGLGVLVVAPAALGAINAVCLTAFYAQKNGIPVRGIVLNRFEKGNLVHEDNKISIEQLTGIPVVACVGEDAQEIEIDLNGVVLQ